MPINIIPYLIYWIPLLAICFFNAAISATPNHSKISSCVYILSSGPSDPPEVLTGKLTSIGINSISDSTTRFSFPSEVSIVGLSKEFKLRCTLDDPSSSCFIPS